MDQEYADASTNIDTKKRRLPKGTSEYQAAWILDNDFSDEETEEIELQSPSALGSKAQSDEHPDFQEWDEGMDDAEVGSSDFRMKCESGWLKVEVDIAGAGMILALPAAPNKC